MKSCKDATSLEKKFQFWIRETATDENIESLITSYYKVAKIFIFVYSVTDRKSFENLPRAITNARMIVGADQFKGVLIANKNDCED